MKVTVDNKSFVDCDLATLISANRVIVSRIRVLQGRREEDMSASFSVGDEVEFTTKKYGMEKTVTGYVTKVNRKSVKVLTDGGTRTWRVSPSLLTKTIVER